MGRCSKIVGGPLLKSLQRSPHPLHTVFLALIVSRFRYALSDWICFLSREQVGQINAFLKRIYRCGFSSELIQLETLTLAADNRLFVKMCGQVQCLHSSLPPATNYSLKHRPNHHRFELPHYSYDLNLILILINNSQSSSWSIT